MDDITTEDYFDYTEGNYSTTPDVQSGNEDYIFDKIYIRVIFITLYSIVFCLCFFGKWNTKMYVKWWFSKFKKREEEIFPFIKLNYQSTGFNKLMVKLGI